MSHINIRHAHAKTLAQARAAVEEAAHKLTKRFGTASHWDGDTLQITQAGIAGTIRLLPQQVQIEAELGFLLSAMQPMMEAEIRRLLTEKLA